VQRGVTPGDEGRWGTDNVHGTTPYPACVFYMRGITPRGKCDTVMDALERMEKSMDPQPPSRLRHFAPNSTISNAPKP